MLQIYYGDTCGQDNEYGLQYVDEQGKIQAKIGIINWKNGANYCMDNKGKYYNIDLCYLENLETIGEQHKGYGTKMMLEFFDLLTNKSKLSESIQRIELLVDIDNITAINFYTKLGFTIVEDKEMHYMFLMRKEIKPFN